VAFAALERERAALRARSGALARTLAQKYPAYYALTHPRPADPAALQSLLAPGQLMLVYSVLDDASALWVIDRQRVQLFSLPGATTLAAGVAAVLNGPLAMQNAVHLNGAAGTTALGRIAAATLPGYERDAYALYRQLVPEAAQPALDAAQSLLIVPTGPLYKLPFDILVTRDPATPGAPRYLLEEHDVTYLSSASLLAVLRAAEADRRRAPYPILAFARPAFGAGAPADATHNGPTAASLETHALASFAANGPAAAFDDLPNTEVEAKGVLSVLDPPAASEPLYEGDDASRANLMRLSAADCSRGPCLSDYRYLLFATHAVLPDQVAGLLQPSLVLAHPDRGNGFVTMGDVFGLSLDADFVSLSACNTGGGTYVRGDGVRGLTQAFMYAGTPAVSVNMWELSDVAGSQISPAFYAGLKAGKSPAEALRDAKLAILHGPDPLLQQPYFWGPTVIFGDGARSAAGKGT
jgi:CHAT domain-containing protein